MAKLSLRRPDVQAQVSVILSLASIPFLLVLAFLIARRLDLSQKIIVYVPGGLRLILIYASGLASLGLGVGGFGFGLSSVGQRRNDKPGLSWIGFFAGAASVTLTLILLALFWFWKEPIIVSQ